MSRLHLTELTRRRSTSLDENTHDTQEILHHSNPCIYEALNIPCVVVVWIHTLRKK